MFHEVGWCVSVIYVWAAFWCLICLYKNRDVKSLEWFLLA